MRVHIFLPLVVIVFLGIAGSDGWRRGVALYLLLLFAIAVRLTARLIVAACLGLRLRAILMLPIGSFFAYANPESQEHSAEGAGQFYLAFAGPLANLFTGLLLAATAMGASGQVQLLTAPYLCTSCLVRSMVWMQISLGVLHLVPAYPLDCGRLLRNIFTHKRGFAAAARIASGAGQVLALGLLLAAIPTRSPWLGLCGLFIWIGASIEDQGVFFQSVVDTVRMKEVMLTDFFTLSPSDTLADALSRSIHSLQEDFPVVRGAELVGIINRQRILEALRMEGDGYVQSVMSRAFQVARPDDTLGAIIRRLTGGHGLSLIPVTDAGRVVGVVSVQNLMTSMPLLAEQRRIERLNASE
jgi:CBS domain-containing protein/Zn-dependent protease